MQTLTDDLTAILKSTFQAGADGFRGRIEVDAPAFDSPPTCVALNGTEYPYTPGGTTGPIGITWTAGIYHAISTDLLTYWSIGQSAPQYPTPGSDRSIGNGGGGGTVMDDIIGNGGGIDYLSSSVAFGIRFTMIGPGTLTIETVDGLIVNSGTPYPLVNAELLLKAYRSGANSVIDSDQQPVGALSVTIPDDGYCAHYASLNCVSTGGTPSGGYGLVSVTWTPLVAFSTSGMWTHQTTSYQAKSISIDKSLRMVADQAAVSFANEDLPLGWGPESIFPTNSRIRIYQWYGPAANEVLTFTGIIDSVTDSRDLLTTSITCRDMMAILLDQTFSATAPQGVDEEGAVRTEDNGVYLNREVSYIVQDVITRSGYPAARHIEIVETSYLLEEYVITDGSSWADAIIGPEKLTGLVGFDAWTDANGVFHFAPSVDTQILTEPVPPVYIFHSGEDITTLANELDQYELRTRVKVRGPLTTQTLTDTWRELWRTTKFRYPVGIWYDPADPGNIRVLDRRTKRLYKMRQSDRVVLSYFYVGASTVCPYPLGVSGDPANADVYYLLSCPWRFGVSGGNKVIKMRKSDNHVLARWSIPSGRWSAIKVSAAYMWLTNLDTDRFYKMSKANASTLASYRHTYGSLQSNPSGLMVDGTTLHLFWANGGTTARFLVCSESAPGTVTKVVKTAGSSLHGGEMDTTTHAECYGDNETSGLTAKFTLVAAEDITTEVFAEVIDTDLEDELGLLAQISSREHDSHPTDDDHAYEIRRDTLNVPAVKSLAQATETAARRLDKLARRRDVVDVGIIGNPAIQKSDVVRVIDHKVNSLRDYQIDTYRSQMDATGTYLGTMALLPIADLLDDPTVAPDPPPSTDISPDPVRISLAVADPLMEVDGVPVGHGTRYWPMLGLTSD